MYTGLLHTHRLAVILFLLIYLIKGILLIANRKEQLASFTQKTTWPERIISVLFLLTGIVMLFQVAEITPKLMIKIALVLATIPLAIFAYRKENKLLAGLVILLLVGVYGLAEMNKIGVSQEALSADVISNASDSNYDEMAHGQAIYQRNCIVCHGPEGNLQGSGAKDLTTSQLSDDEIMTLLMEGKNAMPAYGEILSETERKAAMAYVKTFRK